MRRECTYAYMTERRASATQPEANDEVVRGHSSAGRAPALQAGGRRFDPDWLHHTKNHKQAAMVIAVCLWLVARALIIVNVIDL